MGQNPVVDHLRHIMSLPVSLDPQVEAIDGFDLNKSAIRCAEPLEIATVDANQDKPAAQVLMLR